MDVSSYRKLLRYSGRAVMLREPAKGVLKRYLRSRVVSGPKVTPETLKNTIEFMHAAASFNGLERRCVASLAHHHYSLEQLERSAGKKKEVEQAKQFNAGLFRSVVDGLNKTMNISI